MSERTLGIDAYQLTTLVAHADAGRLHHDETMAFFFRRMPASRRYVVFCGLPQIAAMAADMRFDEGELAALLRHPMLGPALAERPEVLSALRDLRGFVGDVDAMEEGTLAYAGPAVDEGGASVMIGGARLTLYTPMLQVRTDMLRAKLVETPWLGIMNYMCMVASKAARVVTAANGKAVMEFGQRRTHPAAALDASYAAYVGGATATSNLAAYARYGIPATGTMDHFAVMASEQPGSEKNQAEKDFFATFAAAFPGAASLLVDTYDTPRGIQNAVAATQKKLVGIRIDSNVSRESLVAARKLLDDLGAPHAKIFVSDGLDEHKVQELSDLADGFGVGENITCSPDAATGIGAVAKLVVNGYGAITMKLAKGSGKATLPGRLQVYRFADHDLVALESEPAKSGGKALLSPFWRGNTCVRKPLPIQDTRTYVREQIAALPAELSRIDPKGAQGEPAARKLVISDTLRASVERLAKEAVQ
jgi:nicotinate phosphoribosyltransferase